MGPQECLYGRRIITRITMETGYQLKIAEFEGPLAKLLELIESKKLPINRLNMSLVTGDFLQYLQTLEKADSRTIADFISVAAKLILIKSHALLPQMELGEEEEKEIVDLETRLKLYKEIKTLEPHIKTVWMKEVSYTRDYLAGVQPGFYLSQEIKGEDLLESIAKLARDLALFFPQQESTKVKLVNLEEKIRELILRVDKVFKTSFNEVTRDKNRSEIIVLFLALLHLLKDNLVNINQQDKFSDIEIVSKSDGTK